MRRIKIELTSCSSEFETRAYCGISGKSARTVGFHDFTRNEYYTIYPRFLGTVEARIYNCCTDPDEDGFGMSHEYDFYYFDEFMEFLHMEYGATISQCYGNNTSKIKGKCDAVWVEKQGIREAFWREHENDSTMVRYQQEKLCYKLG